MYILTAMFLFGSVPYQGAQMYSQGGYGQGGAGPWGQYPYSQAYGQTAAAAQVQVYNILLQILNPFTYFM